MIAFPTFCNNDLQDLNYLKIDHSYYLQQSLQQERTTNQQNQQKQ